MEPQVLNLHLPHQPEAHSPWPEPHWGPSMLVAHQSTKEPGLPALPTPTPGSLKRQGREKPRRGNHWPAAAGPWHSTDDSEWATGWGGGVEVKCSACAHF